MLIATPSWAPRWRPQVRVSRLASFCNAMKFSPNVCEKNLTYTLIFAFGHDCFCYWR